MKKILVVDVVARFSELLFVGDLRVRDSYGVKGRIVFGQQDNPAGKVSEI